MKNNYRNIHIGIIIFCIGLIVVTLLPISGVIVDILSVTTGVAASQFTSKGGKGDELTEENIAKSNKIVMTVLIILLFVYMLLAENITFTQEIFGVSAVAAIILRSLLFLIFDSGIDSEPQE